MAILDAFTAAWELVVGRQEVEVVEPWATDQNAFEEHFGESYENFAEMLEGLDRPHHNLYETTLKTNPEAAVVWVFFVGKLEGSWG